MLPTEEARQRFRQVRIKLIERLAVNALVPVVLYLLLRPLFADDATPLAIAGVVPALRTITLWIWRRRVDWIGVYAVLGLAVAIAASVLSGGNTLLLKVHAEFLTGAIGLVLFISALMKRPLLQPILQIWIQNSLEQSSNPVSYKNITLITALLGLALLGNAAAHIVLALTLPTATFLGLSRVVTLALLGGGLAFIWWMRRRVGGFAAQEVEHDQ